MVALRNSLAKAGINTFFFLLVFSIALAYFFPEFGTDNNIVPFILLTYYGISLIFFFYGVKLSLKNLIQGLSNWKLHLLIQATTFLVFPAVILILNALFGKDGSYLWIGIFYLAALPSTVSSSVVMVSIAGGNMPAAIFNASISSVIGIFITPL